MKHLPFETWLFEDSPPSPGNARELQDHLETCEQCSELAEAWREVTHQLETTGAVAPATGFTARWRARLDTRRKETGRRNMRLIVLFVSTGLLVLSAIIASELIPALTPIAPEVFEWLGKAINIIVRLNLVRVILSVLVDSFYSAIPLVYRLALPAALAALSVVWFISIQKLGYIPMRRK